MELSKIIIWHEQNKNSTQNFGVASDHEITVPRSIELCDESNLSMITPKYKDKVKQLLSTTKCRLIIMPESLFDKSFNVQGKAFLFSDNPKDVLVDFCRMFLGFDSKNTKSEIHPSAIIETGARVGKDVVIGANVFISADSVIGNNCSIHANTVIKNSNIGDNVRIGANNTIGENGFGYNKLESGIIEPFPHYGRVIIKDNVDIGNNTCIDRGSLSDTIIESGVKIDNLVHVAHNVYIGENSLIIACSMIAGSVVIGKNGWIAPSSSIRNGISIGENVTVGLGSTVAGNVGDNLTVMGSPAMPKEDFFLIRNQQKELINQHRKSNETRED